MEILGNFHSKLANSDFYCLNSPRGLPVGDDGVYRFEGFGVSIPICNSRSDLLNMKKGSLFSSILVAFPALCPFSYQIIWFQL